MHGKVVLQGIQLQWGRGWVFPLCCFLPLVGALAAVALGLFSGWQYYLLLATCPLCHLLVIWFARHHLMQDEEPETLASRQQHNGA
ncbi:MAG: hypothetical protein ACREOH_02940 [Candidatus Entotheonellia bacterium]